MVQLSSSRIQFWMLIRIPWGVSKGNPCLGPIPDQLNQKIWRGSQALVSWRSPQGDSNTQPGLRTNENLFYKVPSWWKSWQFLVVRALLPPQIDHFILKKHFLKRRQHLSVPFLLSGFCSAFWRHLSLGKMLFFRPSKVFTSPGQGTYFL